MNLDYNRLLRVALSGAITAVAADLAYTQFGDQLGPLLSGLLKNFGGGNTPTPPNVGGGA